MLRFLNYGLPNITARMQYSTRNLKPLKFIPALVKTTPDESNLPPPTKIDLETAEYLEKLSLVGFENEETIKIVEDAIRFADQILEVDTKEVKPLVNVLENECLCVREDVAEMNCNANELLLNCKYSMENYFIAPIGNIKYVPKSKIKLHSETNNFVSDKENICQN